ncbi:MAG: hypothetical protein WC141_09435 [Arcobacteraceae bacterium]
MTTEELIRNQIMDNIFNERPGEENDWDVFMETTPVDEEIDGFIACEEFEWNSIHSLREKMKTDLLNLCALQEDIKSSQSLFIVEQYDIHFSKSSRVFFGVFDSKEKAIEEMEKGFETLYLGFNDFIQENGKNQWVVELLDMGVEIREIQLNQFGEV